jgi:hypothetical protein
MANGGDSSPIDAVAVGATRVDTSADCGTADLPTRRPPGKRPVEVPLGVTARPPVVLLHGLLATELDLGLDESLADQGTHHGDLLLGICSPVAPADVSTMPG